MLFLFFIALTRCEEGNTNDFMRVLTDFIFKSVTFQEFSTTFMGIPQDEADQAYQDLLNFSDSISVNNKVPDDIAEEYKQAHIDLYLNFDTKIIEYFKNEDGKVDEEFVSNFIETSKIFNAHIEVFKIILESVGYTGAHGVDVLTLIDSREKMEKTSINDMIKYMGLKADGITNRMKKIYEYLTGQITNMEILKTLGAKEETVNKGFNLVKELYPKNEFSVKVLVEAYKSEADIATEIMKDIYNSVLKDLYDLTFSNFDIEKVNITNIIQETYNLLKDVQKDFNGELDQIIEPFDSFMNNGLNFTELLFPENSQEEIKKYFDPVIKILSKGATIKDYMDVIKEYFDDETAKLITSVVDAVNKLGNENTTLQEAINSLYIPNSNDIYQIIRDSIKSIGTRTGNFYDGLDKVLDPVQFDEVQFAFTTGFQQFVEEIKENNYPIQRYFEIPQNTMDEIDEWIPLTKTLADLCNIIGVKYDDITHYLDGFLVFLDDYRDDVDIDSLYQFLSDIVSKLKESKETTTIKDFLKSLGCPIDKISESLNKIWESMKKDPIKNVVVVIDEQIKYVKFYQSIVDMSKLKYFTLQNMYNAIVYDESFDPNFRTITSFFPKFEERLYKASQKIINGQELTLKDIASIFYVEKYFFEGINEIMKVYNSMDLSLVTIVYNITDYDFTNTSNQVISMLNKVVTGQPVNFNDVKSIENSIHNSVNPQNQKKSNTLTIILIVVGCVVVLTIIVVIAVVVHKKRRSKFELTGTTENLLI